ncbi:MAG: protein-export chaperone SecB [Gammaproteobacteria bacterium]|nr:protein-export chaperone SecB [Gammaproteobacteria bacterium]
MSTETQKPENKQPQHEFSIQRIYTKDLSYEAPNTPDIFQIEWAPQVDLNLNTDAKKLADNVYEVVLQATVTVKLKDKIAFLVEVKQAGIFTLNGFTEEQTGPMLGSFCPNILFPYARELISETISRGNFPPLYLAPINFDAFYQEKLDQEKK